MSDPERLRTVVPDLLHRVPGVARVELHGSRRRGDAGRFSDWDFLVWTDALDATSEALPASLDLLAPLVMPWDRLSDSPCFMLVLPGPVKVDLIFDGLPHAHEPPWTVERSTLSLLDAHFWDWTLWLLSKVDAGKSDQVRDELAKMHRHLLAPLGAPRPTSVPEAVALYRSRLAHHERQLRVRVNPTLGRAVAPLVDLLRS